MGRYTNWTGHRQRHWTGIKQGIHGELGRLGWSIKENYWPSVPEGFLPSGCRRKPRTVFMSEDQPHISSTCMMIWYEVNIISVTVYNRERTSDSQFLLEVDFEYFPWFDPTAAETGWMFVYWSVCTSVWFCFCERLHVVWASLGALLAFPVSLAFFQTNTPRLMLSLLVSNTHTWF